MADRWPPEGYSKPKKYTRNEWAVYGFMGTLALVFLFISRSAINAGVTQYVELASNVGKEVGLIEYPLIFTLFTTGFAAIFLQILFKKLIVPIHERIHYEVAEFFDNNPKYGYEQTLLSQNPCVTPLTTRITVSENIAGLIAPFVVIGVISFIVMQLTSGLIAAIAGLILVLNSGGSGQDIYHVARLLFMPKGTEFANFEEDNEIKTEYAIPIEETGNTRRETGGFLYSNRR